MSPYLVLLLSLAATLAVMYVFHEAIEQRDRARFENAVQATHDRIQGRLDTHLTVLMATRGFFATQRDPVTVREFRDFVSHLELRERYPGILGIGFSQRLPAEELGRVEDELRDQGQKDFRVWPRDSRPEIHTITLLEPLDGRNRVALGYDMFTHPVRREAMKRARDTGLPAASGRVSLVSELEPENQVGFIIYVPVYRAGTAPTTVEERREALVGFVYSPFRMGDLFAGIFGTERAPRVSFMVHDGPLPLSSELMHDSDASDSGRAPRFETSELVPIAGRTWRFTFRSQPFFEVGSGRLLVPYVAVFGFLVSGILFMVSRGQARAHRRLGEHARALEQMSEERTELLAREQAARAEAEDANRAKDEFLAMLGHELRNPLAPIVTAIELVKLRAGGTLDREHQVIQRQVAHVVRLVDDLLDVSRITRGKVSLRRQPVEIGGLVARAVEMASPVLEEQQHHLALRVPSGELWVDGDETRLAQVVANLLSNAAKYTEPGGRIELEARREGDQVALVVSDNGIGIGPDLLPRVFDLFTQGKRGPDRSKGGLGLGLTLVRRLVEAHGGEVIAESDGAGQGSRFTVRLSARTAPELAAAARATPARATPERAPGGRSRRVLVVDDNHDAADLMAELLRGAGHEVAVAHDGPQALEIADGFDPEVAVLDIGLPVMDGYELGARLKQAGQPRLLAVTGYGQDHDRARSREAGFAAHLVKPIDPARLLAAIAADGPDASSSQRAPAIG